MTNLPSLPEHHVAGKLDATWLPSSLSEQATKDLKLHNLPSHFSYRLAYCLGYKRHKQEVANNQSLHYNAMNCKNKEVNNGI